MRRTFLSATLVILSAAGCVLASDGATAIIGRFSVQPILEYQGVSLDNYRDYKQDIFNNFRGTAEDMANMQHSRILENNSSVSYPKGLFNYGLQGNYALTPEITVAARALFSSAKGSDSFNFRDAVGDYGRIRQDWSFDLADIGIGGGYTINELPVERMNSTLGLFVGTYSMNYKATGSVDYGIQMLGDYSHVSTEDTISKTVVYAEPSVATCFFITPSKDIALTAKLAYIIMPDIKDSDYEDLKLNFSGFKAGIGLNVGFNLFTR